MARSSSVMGTTKLSAKVSFGTGSVAAPDSDVTYGPLFPIGVAKSGSEWVRDISRAPLASNSAAVPPQPQTTLTPAYPVGNGTTPGGPVGGTVTLKTSTNVAAGTGTIPAATASATGSVPVTANGAGRVAAGSVALVAGVMAAVFAL